MDENTFLYISGLLTSINIVSAYMYAITTDKYNNYIFGFLGLMMFVVPLTC